jgi:hypothetical protein
LNNLRLPSLLDRFVRPSLPARKIPLLNISRQADIDSLPVIEGQDHVRATESGFYATRLSPCPDNTIERDPAQRRPIEMAQVVLVLDSMRQLSIMMPLVA